VAQPIEYLNLQTGKKIVLENLTEEEQKLYREAVKEFMTNINCWEFERFISELIDLIRYKVRAHTDLIENPLYMALEDMWLQLGVQQGEMRRDSKIKSA